MDFSAKESVSEERILRENAAHVERVLYYELEVVIELVRKREAMPVVFLEGSRGHFLNDFGREYFFQVLIHLFINKSSPLPRRTSWFLGSLCFF